MSYIELQVTSNYTFLRGGSHPEELVAQAAELGYPAIALTDTNTLAGVVRAHAEAKKHNIKLIVGSRITFTDDASISLLLYPTNRAAYGRLSTLLTVGKFRAPKGKCFLTLEDVATYHEGLIAIAVIEALESPTLEARLVALQNIFNDDRFSLAISRSYEAEYHLKRAQIVALATKLSIPLVVTNDVHYHAAERRMLQDVLTCIHHRCTIENAGFLLFANAERYLKSLREMQRLFKDLPAALERTNHIFFHAQTFSLDDLRYEYPHEICPDEKTPEQYLHELTWQGAATRYPEGIPEKVSTQLKHELQLIKELRYEKYFLTVYDIVCFARSRGIFCQGRGAAANSAVCYVLGITAIDPDRIRLLFERFISKERNEPPDIDIDFEHERREEVIQYIYQKYGRLRAALVAEVISYRTRSAFRDVGKVFGLSEEEIVLARKAFGKQIPISTGTILWREMLRHFSVPEGNAPSLPKMKASACALGNDGAFPSRREDRDRDLIRRIHRTMELSACLRSFPRHLSQHVGGFVISETPLCEMVPIENAAMPDRTVIEWDKYDVDIMGMLKVDVLGLGMLTAIRKGLALINEHSLHHEHLELYNVPAEDPAVYEMACKADTIGVFQIESRAQMSMLPRIRPKCFYDLVVEVAIVRPGPIQGGMVHPYIRRRNNEEPVTYPSAEIEEVLKSTLGVPIFQEQIMELTVVGAGFSPGEADELRRALAKWNKKGDLLKTFERRIVDGMIANGYSPDYANLVFKQITGFSEYGFPQSHSASFALLAYISAWLKRHHPAAFTAALINSQPMGFYQPAQLIQDAQRHGVVILPVDVNFSAWDCTLENLLNTEQQSNREKTLRLGLRLVKGLRADEAERLVRCVKAHGHFSSLKKFWRASAVRVTTLRTLAQADAFQSFGLGRQEALWELRKFRDEPLPLFESKTEIELPVQLPTISPQTHVMKDYQTKGFSLAAHPLSFLRPALSRMGVVTAAELQDSALYPSGIQIAAAGIVLVRQRPMTASGIVFMTIEDETGFVNCILKPKIFAAYEDIFRDSVMIYVSGRLQHHHEVLHLLPTEARNLSSAIPELHSLSRDFH